MRQFLVHRAAPAAAFALTLIAAGGPAAAFTAQQAQAGMDTYNGNCAQCHGRHLEGTEAPGLVGVDVMSNWATPGGLYDFISVAMPPTAPGQLGEDNYVNIVAYIMQFNGAQPDDTALALGPQMASISLPEVTSAGDAMAAMDAGGATPAAADATPVPQAYTWGKQLPGGAAPTTMRQAEAASPAAVPQAYTHGKDLPTAN